MTNQSRIEEFAAQLRGSLIQPGEPDYDRCRQVWNGMIDRRPSFIARCLGTADIITAVRFAQAQDLPLSIKGGGHNVAGKAVCDDGLVIDLSLMRDVRVDLNTRSVRVAPGSLLGDLDHETQAFGLATTGGIVSQTGVAGLTLGGGIGYLARRFGLTLDNLLSADVVTASGACIKASQNHNSDLFWGLRGGGGNFGIVTSFEFQLHEVGPDVLAAQIFYPYEEADKLLKTYRDVMAEAPDELACYALALNVPPAAPFPEEFWGKTCMLLLACYSGEVEAGYPLLAPFRELGKPILEAVGPMPYTALQKNFDAGVPDGGRYYWKAHYCRSLSDEAIADFVAHTSSLPGPMSLVGFEPMGGAIRRVEPGATAFPDRDAAFALGIWTGWSDSSSDNEIIQWARDFHRTMAPHCTGGVYSNYLDQDDDARVEGAFGPNHLRLQRIKSRYDPHNFFRLNQNIVPAD